MPQFFQQYGMLIILVVAMVCMMMFQTRNAKKRQAEMRSFHESLEPGTEIITIGGIIGKIVSVDTQYEEIVIDSEGSLMRVSFRAVNRLYVRPAFISDEEAEAAQAEEAKQDDANKSVNEDNKPVSESAESEK
ncbi:MULTISPECIES: preprotein translocase subunit YajC [Gardnerella]|uniref:Preprotein translocase subunit YajC n=2 Tax=Gardnerella TaxID=2701 RepID=A0AAP8LSG1_GARVA|nr:MULTISPECIES: preprotein translocase subunit YajC [Gardnerella]EIK78855.1 preprotein translocase, YajC subunit [Gardnerella vaginalis 6420B]NSX31043.1 preprotein translocase subunit YajC [Gardnerella vaginalis]RFT29906.1 preprotein translocase subunit YajC [Bifidobacteriaceae bacterium VN003]RFT34547.1 preprotein translocase subunit YajC [Bifidobacteriaceae bacterium NR019]RFT36413.1 preprotein translocase subunit YajC [Bifidobacteriaceae bacterium NR017]RIY28042.1 preprotein translocase s